jgi:acyl carrier protein
MAFHFRLAGRLHRLAVVALLAALLGTSSLAALEPADVTSRVSAIVVEVLGVDAPRVTPDARLREDLGATKTDVDEIIRGLEAQFSLEISDEEAPKMITVGDAIQYVLNNAGDPN